MLSKASSSGTLGSSVASCASKSCNILSIDVGRKNLALCVLKPGADPHGRTDAVQHWAVLQSAPTSAGVRKTLEAAGVAEWAFGPVVIERQPARNPTMKRMEAYLDMYFTMLDRDVVVLQDPRLKLSFAATTPWWPSGEMPSWTYYMRKKISVLTTKAFLGDTQQDPAITGIFSSSTKKDDLGDALLQGMAFAHKMTPTVRTAAATAAADAGGDDAASASGNPIVKIVARKPTPRQIATKRYSMSNIKHFVKDCPTQESLSARANEVPGLRRAIQRLFGDLPSAFTACK